MTLQTAWPWHALFSGTNFHPLCMQVWTFKNRVAFVLSVTDKGVPIRDGIKLQRLKQLLCQMMDSQGRGVVNIKMVSPPATICSSS